MSPNFANAEGFERLAVSANGKLLCSVSVPDNFYGKESTKNLNESVDMGSSFILSAKVASFIRIFYLLGPLCYLEHWLSIKREAKKKLKGAERDDQV